MHLKIRKVGVAPWHITTPELSYRERQMQEQERTSTGAGSLLPNMKVACILDQLHADSRLLPIEPVRYGHR
jgi:hypothetical protein